MRAVPLLVRLTASGALLLSLAACSDADEPAPAAATTDQEARSEILQPGRPGEANETLDPGTTLESARWNDADATFMQMMVPHHAQALEMSELAETRAADPAVRSLARRIQGAQGPEIRSMAQWLATRDLAVPESMDDLGAMDHSGHGAMPMAGMLTEEQMAELRRARGARFDALFLAGMIQHHEGAIAMAGEELDAGSDLLALELAAEISTGQLAEIDRMEDLRAR